MLKLAIAQGICCPLIQVWAMEGLVYQRRMDLPPKDPRMLALIAAVETHDAEQLRTYIAECAGLVRVADGSWQKAKVYTNGR